MLNIVVMVSGGGTNLQAVIDAVESGEITNTRIVGVISNNKNAYALERARTIRSGSHSSTALIKFSLNSSLDAKSLGEIHRLFIPCFLARSRA